MAKTKATKPVIEPVATNDGGKMVGVRDALYQLRDEVVYPLQALADLLTNANPDIAMRVSPQTTLEGIGWLLDALVVKAEAILREHLGEGNED
jgi:hypothetical protein